MKIAIFFTYDYSLDTLSNSGLLDRELKIYSEISKKFDIKFKFFTYDKSINKFDFDSNFEFIPIYSFAKRFNNKILRLLFSFFIPFKIKNQLTGVDLIHQHQLLGSWITIFLKYLLKKPLLIRTGYDAYLFSIKEKDSFVKQTFYKFLTKISLKRADLFTVTSYSDKNFIKNNFKFNQLKVVPNWIENSKISSSKRKGGNILMIGRLEKQKNYPLAFEFLSKISNDYQLDIYGSGSEKEFLKNKALNNNLKINFLGNITYELLQEKYKEYEYFLSTSDFEGNPKTVLEAISNECVVFASNIPNHSEIISNGENGILFNNVNDLIEKFNSTVSNYELKNSIRKNCQLSLKNNNIEHITEIMYFDYLSLTESK